MNFVREYQRKIGKSDADTWERKLDDKHLGLHNAPRKMGKLKPELIDVDLVSGEYILILFYPS